MVFKSNAQRIYMDYAATTPLRAAAKSALLEVLDIGVNASSVHSEGQKTRAIIEKNRSKLAEILNCKAGQIIFTSGGTEANMLALSPIAGDIRFNQILVSATEHDSVLCGGRFDKDHIFYISSNPDGTVNLAHLESLLDKESSPCLVSVMLINNENGIIQPITEVLQLVRHYNACLHCDASQAFGKIELDLSQIDADFISLSSHKIGGPLGVGALITKNGLTPCPIMRGGGQEHRLRAGTEAAHLIAGFVAAVDDMQQNFTQEQMRISDLGIKLDEALLEYAPNAIIAGDTRKRVPHIRTLITHDIHSEIAIISLDLAGIAASAGSACSSGKVTPSHVLRAMGYSDEEAARGLRFSIGYKTTDDDINLASEIWKNTYNLLLKSNKPAIQPA